MTNSSIDHRRAADRERQRKCRALKAAGKFLVPVLLDEVDDIEALVAAGLLHPADVDDKAKIGEALERAVVRIVGADTCHV